MPTLTILRGLPGSGKSTYAKKLNCFHIEADMYHVVSGEYKFEAANLPNAHKFCLDMACTAMGYGCDVCVSNTFMRVDHMADYIDEAKMAKYNVVVIHLTNEFGNIHGVPQVYIDLMKSNWEPYEGETIMTS